MHQLEFQEISGRNFQSFKEFTLPIKPGKHLVIGEVVGSTTEESNGAGKSTIFESVAWTGFKYSNRDKNPSTDQKGNCLTSLKLRKNAEQYRVDRYLGDPIFTNKVKIFQNEEDLTFRKSFSTEDELKKIISISPEILVSTIVLSQGLPINFTQLGPTVRKSMIEEYLGFSVWNQFRPRFSHHLKNLNLSRSAIFDEYLVAQKKLNLVTQNYQVQQSIEGTNKDAIGKELESLTLEVKGHEDNLGSLQSNRSLVTDKNFSQLMNEHNSLMQSLSSLKNRIKVLDTVVHKKTCGECDQPYPVDRIASAEQELGYTQKKVQSVQVYIEKMNVIINTSKNFDRLIGDEQNSKNLKLQKIKSLNEKLTSYHSEALDGLLSAMFERDVEAKALAEKVTELDQSIDHVKYLDSLLLPSSYFRTKVLENYLSYINSLIASVSPLIFDKVEVKLVIEEKNNGVDFLITKNGIKKSYQSLSGGERRRLDLICILSFQKFLIESSGVSSNLLVFDEIFDHIDAKGLDSILSSLDVFFPESSSIYIISHNNNLKSRFSSVINVIKKNDNSELDLTRYTSVNSM